MSFLLAEFYPSNLPQNSWLNPDNLVSASTKTPASSKALQPLDLSIMDNVLAERPPTLSQCPNPYPYGDRPWYDPFSANEIRQSQDASHNFGQGQHTVGGNYGNTGPMLHFQGNMMAPDQESLQGQQNARARIKQNNQLPKRRGKPRKNTRDGPAQKRKRTSNAVAACDYLNGATCDEECNSTAGSSSTCCSSCSDGLPCADPHCAVPCAESSCEKPICPEDCPLDASPQARQVQFQQGFIPSSERLSFLQHTNAEPWNPVGSRTPPSTKEVYIQTAIDPALTDPELTSQYGPQPESSSPPTPSMAQNMATPYSSEAALQTLHFMGQGPQVGYSNEPSAVIGAGGMFNYPTGDWTADNSANTGHDLLTSNCAWYGCNQLIPDELIWQHLHQAHVDPQIDYACPFQSNDCPPTLGTNALSHLQTQHGFDMNENFSCPAPTCSPAETYNDPAMFHNHFDQAHAIPAQGFLHCRLYSCDGSFLDPNKLLSHINESHHIPVPPPKMATDAMKTETGNYPLSIPDNEELVEHNCKWKIGGGRCGEICGTEKDLQDHVKIKHLSTLSKNTGYICQWAHCNRPAKMGDKQGFSQRGKLERHMASHTNYKCCQCDICGQFFSAEQAMKQHKLLHTGEKPWKCKYCDKCFPQQSACTIHERTHTKDKPLKCDVCGKRFSESSNFAKHRRTHGEMGKHACEYPGCEKNFHRSDQLKKHMKTHDKHRRGDPGAPSSDVGSGGSLTPSTDEY